jgi:hypothetical protein
MQTMLLHTGRYVPPPSENQTAEALTQAMTDYLLRLSGELEEISTRLVQMLTRMESRLEQLEAVTGTGEGAETGDDS